MKCPNDQCHYFSREMRFRIWDKKRKVMISWDSILKANPSLQDMLSEEYVWMFFIGRLDKNNIEIYEGDILRLTCGCGHQENLPVESQTGYNGYFAKAIYQHDWDNHQLELKWTEHDTEIIGNVYQNPELLKEV